MAKLMTESAFTKASEAYRGFCVKCGKFTRGETEPDAHGYDCPKCKGQTVMGAEDALMMGHIGIK